MSQCGHHSPCPQLPGTIINICKILRSPLLGSISHHHHHHHHHHHSKKSCDDVRSAGGKVEFI